MAFKTLEAAQRFGVGISDSILICKARISETQDFKVIGLGMLNRIISIKEVRKFWEKPGIVMCMFPPSDTIFCDTITPIKEWRRYE